MTPIDRILSICPCPVIFGEWFWMNYGMYDYRQFTNKRIQIDQTKPKHVQIAVLAHEVGHALCDAKNCRCRRANSTLSEFHAQLFALSTLLEHKSKKALNFLISIIEEEAASGNSIHARADRHIMRLFLWKKCKRFADS